jgi:hypothetical protein
MNGVEYQQEIIEVAPIKDLDISIKYIRGVFWEIKLINNTNSLVKLDWDESVYVNTVGLSSRLIRGETKKIHSDQLQPQAIIPNGATISSYFTAEMFLEYIDLYITPTPTDTTKKGKIYLSLLIGDKKEVWKGEVGFQSKTE